MPHQLAFVHFPAFLPKILLEKKEFHFQSIYFLLY
nr:MAG TPA: hypothetical protein [Caudoviricetes sp.]